MNSKTILYFRKRNNAADSTSLIGATNSCSKA
jgi:hypothetical protein